MSIKTLQRLPSSFGVNSRLYHFNPCRDLSIRKLSTNSQFYSRKRKSPRVNPENTEGGGANQGVRKRTVSCKPSHHSLPLPHLQNVQQWHDWNTASDLCIQLFVPVSPSVFWNCSKHIRYSQCIQNSVVFEESQFGNFLNCWSTEHFSRKSRAQGSMLEPEDALGGIGTNHFH